MKYKMKMREIKIVPATDKEKEKKKLGQRECL